MQKKILLGLVMVLLLSLSVFGFDASRTISGNTVSVTINPQWTGSSIPTYTLTETVVGAALDINNLPSNANCGVDGSVLTCVYSKSTSVTLMYGTIGSGSVSGTITGKENPASSSTDKVVTGDTAIPKTAACASNWVTGEWSTCVNGQKTRTVTDSNNCSPPTGTKPATTESCVVTPTCEITCLNQKDDCLFESDDSSVCDNNYNTCIATCVAPQTPPVGSCTSNTQCSGGEECKSGVCTPSVKGISVDAENQTEAFLFQRIHDALKKYPGQPIKQMSAVAGVFKCYLQGESVCPLKDYIVN